jgi:biotin carboxyl carrier protein
LELKEIKEIKAIIDLMKRNGLSVFEIEKEGFRLKLQRAVPDQTTTSAPPAASSSSKTAAIAAEPGRAPREAA